MAAPAVSQSTRYSWSSMYVGPMGTNIAIAPAISLPNMHTLSRILSESHMGEVLFNPELINCEDTEKSFSQILFGISTGTAFEVDGS